MCFIYKIKEILIGLIFNIRGPDIYFYVNCRLKLQI